MHMNRTSGLRRTITPTTPMVNSAADSSRYQVVVGTIAAITCGAFHVDDVLALARLAGQHHGADDGDDEQHGGELEREHVVAEQVAGERLDVAVVRRRAPRLARPRLGTTVGTVASRETMMARPTSDQQTGADDDSHRSLHLERFDAQVLRRCRRRAA